MKNSLALILIQIILVGCAGQPSKEDIEFSSIKKTILLDSVSEISSKCHSDDITKRHIECIFIAQDKDYIELPAWLRQLSVVRAEWHQKNGADQVLNAKYDNLVSRRVFIPENQSIPLTDTVLDNFKYVFFIITVKNFDGIKVYSIKPNTIQGKDLTPVQDYSYESWKIINEFFPVANSDSQESLKFVQLRKIAFDEYKNDYKNAKNSQQITSFIKTYSSNDPENLIRLAKKQLDDLNAKALEEEQEKIRKSELPIVGACGVGDKLLFKGGWVVGAAVKTFFSNNPVDVMEHLESGSEKDKYKIAADFPMKFRWNFDGVACDGVDNLGPRIVHLSHPLGGGSIKDGRYLVVISGVHLDDGRKDSCYLLVASRDVNCLR